uniref:Uncharacterized protein n=1 Tax=Anguilla anguilla TaxID=7936 RepID=A0A0E9SL16_ANGAN
MHGSCGDFSLWCVFWQLYRLMGNLSEGSTAANYFLFKEKCNLLLSDIVQ